ncbi:MAG: hypothetical protein LBD35_04170, partial [Prevotellaceae bacterium]|nr:hypothetical protein [Prevotellaceae bacterium]
MKRIELILLLISFMLPFGAANAQCSFDIETEVTDASCPGNGKIVVRLSSSGEPITQRIVRLKTGSGIELSPERTVDNTAYFSGLVPGEYEIVADAACEGEQAATRGGRVTVHPTYHLPYVYVVSVSNFIHDCVTKGSIVIDIIGGRAPYQIMTANDNGETLTFLIESPGRHEISGMSAGLCNITLTDACGSSPPTVRRQIDEIVISPLNTFVHSINNYSCPHISGSVYFHVKDGVIPYRIKIKEHPAEYGGQTEFVTGPGYPYIGNMPEGEYVISIVDGCHSYDVEPEFTVNIQKKDENRVSATITEYSDCDGSGDPFEIKLHGGAAPYRIEMLDVPEEFNKERVYETNQTEITFFGFPLGDYLIGITDMCNAE